VCLIPDRPPIPLDGGYAALRNILDVSVTTAEWDMAESHNFLSEGRHLIPRIPAKCVGAIGEHVAIPGHS